MRVHKVIDLRAVSRTAFVIKMTRENVDFVPGLHITVGLPGSENRPYSIYSGVDKDYLEILVKEIPNGIVTPQLRCLKVGDALNVGQPRGYFCLPSDYYEKRMCLIATGTGIAPFHSFIDSFPDLSYHLFHGVRDLDEAYDLNFYHRANITICTSRTDEGDVCGRVTKAIRQIDFNQFDDYYLCGNYEMLDDVYDLLQHNGVSRANIKTEGYF